jgi:hypothetical protein
MSTQTAALQRFHELNYLINEAVALRVRDFISEYLEMSEESVGRANFSYEVHTLCLDSDALTLYWQAVNDVEHRHQLRVRYLSLHPDAPVHLEIKRRQADGVIRERCAVRREGVAVALAGQLPEARLLTSRHPGHLNTLQRFVTCAQSIGARPKVHIGFLREGYSSPDNTVRVTMDRDIWCEAYFASELVAQFSRPRRLFPSQVLLELSYHERFPDWFGELVRHFDLMPCEADKFVAAVSTLGCNALGGAR